MIPSPAAAAARAIIAAHGHALRGIPILRLTEALTAPEVLAALRALLAEQDRASAMQARLAEIYDEAARDAAWDAERAWQTDRLFQYLKGER